MHRASLLALVVVVAVACQSRDTPAESAAEEAALRARASERAQSASAPPPTGAPDAPAGHAGHGSHGAALPATPTASNAPYELRFLDTMVVHHAHAVDMARLVEGRTQHAELRALAQKIVADQEGEIARMKAWRQAWFPDAPQAVSMDFPGMKESMQGMDMDALRAAKGPAFDRLFVDQMIPHHEGALVMAQDAQEKARRPEVKKLADEILAAQRKEIDQMKRWSKEWSSPRSP